MLEIPHHIYIEKERHRMLGKMKKHICNFIY